jgi:3-dehydroquinate dehydratase-2
MLNLLVVNGPNLNLLGVREPEIYGNQSLSELNEKLQELADDLNVKLTFFQSNSEGEIIDFIHEKGFKADGMIINPSALTHYSYAIRDAIASVKISAVEVHLSNIHSREEFRKKSLIAPVCLGQITGLGYYGYAMALSFLADTLNKGEE